MSNINFGDIREFTASRNLIRNWAKQLRSLRLKVETTWNEPADWVIKAANIHNCPVRSLTITLTPTGCEWASKGGCTMCGEFEGSTKNIEVSPMFHVAQFASAIGKYVPKNNPEWIRIYQEGNYTNTKEIDGCAQVTILQMAGVIKGVRRITIESMAKYITLNSAKTLRNATIPDVELEIGMGFEAENEVVRNICVNKGERINDYKKAISYLKKAGIRSLAYVLLKPPFLTEREAIDEAISTIHKADELGFDAISLEPVSLHAYSLVHALNSEGKYQLPWLWSIWEIAKQVKNINDFRIGGVGYYPRPVTVAHNRYLGKKCKCTDKFWKAIQNYGKYRDLKVFEPLDCKCKNEWEKECQAVAKPLKDRISNYLKSLNINRYKQYISDKNIKPQSMNDHTTAISGGTQFSNNSD